MDELIEISHLLARYRFLLNNEKECQRQMFSKLKDLGFISEYLLEKGSKIDFYHKEKKIGIEVKVKGNPKEIYVQCERYLNNELVQSLILATNKSINLPSLIKDKPVLVHSLGESWL